MIRPMGGSPAERAHVLADDLAAISVRCRDALFSPGATPPAFAEPLDELRSLFRLHRKNSAVRDGYSAGLASAILAAGRDEAGEERRLFEELSKLCREHPGERALAEDLAAALYDRVDRRPAHRETALAGLRSLVAAHPGSAAIRDRLVSALVRAAAESGRGVGDPAVDELRALATAPGADADTRESFVELLADGLLDPGTGADAGAGEAVLEEIGAIRRSAKEEPGLAAAEGWARVAAVRLSRASSSRGASSSASAAGSAPAPSAVPTSPGSP